MLKETTKAQIMAKLGLNYEVDQHNNAAAMAQLAAKSLGHRASTTAATVSANGGPATASLAPRRVDRLDAKACRSTAESLHSEYMAQLAGRSN